MHFVAKHNRPLTDYNLLAKLDKAKGMDIGSTYLNDKACASFVNIIGEDTRSDMLNDLSDASFYGLTMHGTTDVATIEQESLFVRYVKRWEDYFSIPGHLRTSKYMWRRPGCRDLQCPK